MQPEEVTLYVAGLLPKRSEDDAPPPEQERLDTSEPNQGNHTTEAMPLSNNHSNVQVTPESSVSNSQQQLGVAGLSSTANLIQEQHVKNIIVLAGAGISTSAGIPDFRSPKTGLYANLKTFDLPYPEAIFEISYFKRKPEPFSVLCKDLYPGQHLPTPTHYFFRLLHEHDRLLRVYTQNIDTLERVSGLAPDKIVEAHGSFASSHCIECHSSVDEQEMRERVKEGVVRCRKPKVKGKAKVECGGLVKPDIVFFGEGLPDRFFELAQKDFSKCDLLLVLGTSLKVHPFASLVSHVPPKCPRVLINRERVGESRSSYGHDDDDDDDDGDDDGDSEDEGRERGFDFDRPHSRDTFYQGDTDAAVFELAKALGWKDELDELIRSHRAELASKWNLSNYETRLDVQANDQGSKPGPMLNSSSRVEMGPDTGSMDRLISDLEKAGLEENGGE